MITTINLNTRDIDVTKLIFSKKIITAYNEKQYYEKLYKNNFNNKYKS